MEEKTAAKNRYHFNSSRTYIIKTPNLEGVKNLKDFDNSWDAARHFIMPVMLLKIAAEEFEKYRAARPAAREGKQAQNNISKTFKDLLLKYDLVFTPGQKQEVELWTQELREYIAADIFYLRIGSRQLYIQQDCEDHIDDLCDLGVVMSCLNIVEGFITASKVFTPDQEVKKLQNAIVKLEIAMLGKKYDDDMKLSAHFENEFIRAAQKMQRDFIEFYDKGEFKRINK